MLLKSPPNIGQLTLWLQQTSFTSINKHTMLCLKIISDTRVCKWYFHHIRVCALMGLASPIPSNCDQRPMPHPWHDPEVRHPGACNLHTICVEIMYHGNHVCWNITNVISRILIINLLPIYFCTSSCYVKAAICLEGRLSLLALSSVYSLTVEDGSWSTTMVPAQLSVPL